MPKKKSDYTAEDIYVLEGLDPVRQRPGMYIGSTGVDGLHHLIWECFDNGIDEAMAGYCKEIEVAFLKDNKVRISDDGRGIPVEKHKKTGKSALETVMTTLHAGGKFGSKAYQVSGGLHGVGVSVVCALSEYMRTEVCREGVKYSQEYSRGKVKTKLKKEGNCKRTGTVQIFQPDPEIFKEIRFDRKKVLRHLRQQSYLTSGVKVIIKDERDGFNYTFYFEGGLKSYVKHLLGDAEPKHDNIFYCQGEKEGVLVEVALQYAKEIEIFEESFANNIYTGEGGQHQTGFRTALTRSLNTYARKNGFLKEKDENLSSNDTREGLLAAISVKIREPQFEGQTKAKLGNPEAKTAVEGVFGEAFNEFLEKNPQDARNIIESCLLSARARRAAKAARSTVLRKGVLDGLSLPGKLADCASKKPEDSELYLVEGDSAGGCFSAETKVALLDGRDLSFSELEKEQKQGKKNYCYSIQDDGSVGVGIVSNVRKTRKHAKVLKVLLDNNKEIICTPDHKFMLRGGSYKAARDLSSDDSLMPLRRKLSELGGRITIQGYEMTFCPKKHRWIFTHLLSDSYNLKKGSYPEEQGCHKHHLDFNKLNNNPDNIIRMPDKMHMRFHRNHLHLTLHSRAVKEKCRKIHQTKEFREKIRRIMTTPEMRKMLSERAKNQWQNEDYKKYMTEKFLDFYHNNEEYRKKNRAQLNKNQKEYWSHRENRRKQAERVKNYFKIHPEKKKALSLRAKNQWQDEELLAWRSVKTTEQWTDTFRNRRKKAYNRTYFNHSVKLLKEVLERDGAVSPIEYDKLRRQRRNKNALKYETLLERFFDHNESRLKQVAENYNHKVKKVSMLSKRMDVYDLEVEDTHNFALAAGVFVHNSSKMARDRRFQAILPLRGKILNVERARLDKILSSNEIKSLIIALGTAISQDFDIEKLRYHRIILMADADVDGSHIRTLLLTLFFRYFKEIIEKGYLYIAQPPLYKIQAGKRIDYAYTEADKTEILSDFKGASVNVQRYKGLGEMNPEELWETTMNPENRILLKVAIEDAKEADHIFDTLMGKEVLPRKKFIQNHAKKVKNLDI